MRLSAYKDTDFVNYRQPSMFLGAMQCDFKCCTEGGVSPHVCQNHALGEASEIDVSEERLYELYAGNPLVSAVVIGGLEPMLQFLEVLELLYTFRENGCMDDFAIYTGYREDELVAELEELRRFPNVVVKFGRYVPGDEPHLDPVLGVKLASSNQYAKRIS